jgi:YD repeat-containing protein
LDTINFQMSTGGALATEQFSYHANLRLMGATWQGGSGTSGALSSQSGSYDNLNQFTEWNAGATNQEWDVYDGAGSRVLHRSTTGSSTSLTVYAFGLEEHSCTSAGSKQGNTYYYCWRAPAGQIGWGEHHLLPDRYAGQRRGRLEQHRRQRGRPRQPGGWSLWQTALPPGDARHPQRLHRPVQ